MSSVIADMQTPPKKSRVRTTHKTLIADISRLHKSLEFEFSTNPEKDKAAIARRVTRLVDEFCSLAVFSPGNEQKPWTEQEIGLPVFPMATKRESGIEQVGDYQFYIYLPGEEGIRLGLCIERKEVSDAHGTFILQRDRFYREIDRYKADPGLHQFRVLVEGSKAEFLTYLPPIPRICKYCQSADVMGFGKGATYWCDGRNKDPLGTCEKCRVKIRTTDEIKKMIIRKRATVAGLEARGVSVCFEGSRMEAAASVRDAVRQYAIKHYAEWLNL